MSFSRVIRGIPEVKLLQQISVHKSDCSNLFYTGFSVGGEVVISGQCLINQNVKLLGDRSYQGTSLYFMARNQQPIVASIGTAVADVVEVIFTTDHVALATGQ